MTVFTERRPIRGELHTPSPSSQEVKEHILEVGRVSTSSIQRKFCIGFVTAMSLIDHLEEVGFIKRSWSHEPWTICGKPTGDTK